jgi:hypothetical protein
MAVEPRIALSIDTRRQDDAASVTGMIEHEGAEINTVVAAGSGPARD